MFVVERGLAGYEPIAQYDIIGARKRTSATHILEWRASTGAKSRSAYSSSPHGVSCIGDRCGLPDDDFSSDSRPCSLAANARLFSPLDKPGEG